MYNILLAGFGGQGILFAGKQIAYAGMKSDKEVSWLPSYGPEMRGGTANCSVIVSDEPIGSPLVTEPDILIALNLPSFEKFEDKIKAGGILISDSSLIPKKTERTDITAYYIPATELADENDIRGMANVIMLGKLIKVTGIYDYDYFENVMTGSIPPSKARLIDLNKKALAIGYNHE